MGWLDDLLRRARGLKKQECGNMLPENPTLADFQNEAFRIAQLAKEVQNVKHHWSADQWREVSKAIERLEKL